MTNKSLSATRKALSAASAFPVYRDTMSGRLLCGGRGVGCWQVKRGETLAFKKH